jgi:CheY-like chemotaxis protein/two-component sensor histidine kinase
VEDVLFTDVRDYVVRTFRHVAEGKGLVLNVELDNDLPKIMATDNKRLQQVLKNLLSNALKFTEEGQVQLRIRRVDSGWNPENEVLNSARHVLAFEVRDTGIGIADDKQQIIWEAFRQADGTTSRKYGGTGLGLSISREIARLLGGEIHLESTPGVGSTFTMFLPQSYAPIAEDRRRQQARAALLETRAVRSDLNGVQKSAAAAGTSQNLSSSAAGAPLLLERVPAEETGPRVLEEPPVLLASDITDDRASLVAGDKIILIIEDDVRFIPLLMEMARERGFKCVVAPRGDKGLTLAREVRPAAITLDIRLPDMAGWLVLSRLKYDPATRHIPVHVISVDEDYRRGLALGAESYLEKTENADALRQTFEKIQKSVRDSAHLLLLVDGDEARRTSTTELIGDNGGILTTAVASGEEAVRQAQNTVFDCAVVTPPLEDMTIPELVEKIQKQGRGAELPTIVYASDGLDREEELELRRVAETVVVKSVSTKERLLEETAVFLNRREEDLTDEQKRIIQEAREKESLLTGGKVLIVDDDVRNIFALTSGLERHKLTVLHAESGRAGIEMLKQNPEVDLVLMDIMMPEMDGYETTRAMRALPEFQNLPIIALTAKAMKGDREKCIEAGASDYIPKPVVLEELVALLRVWLPQVNSQTAAEVVGANDGQ